MALLAGVLLLAGCGGLPDAEPLTAPETIDTMRLDVPGPSAHPALGVREAHDACRSSHDCLQMSPSRVRLGRSSGRLAYVLIWEDLPCMPAGPGGDRPLRCTEYVVADAGTGATLLHYSESGG